MIRNKINLFFLACFGKSFVEDYINNYFLIYLSLEIALKKVEKISQYNIALPINAMCK